MPKTGGSWVEHYLIHALGGTIYPHLPGHAPAAQLPAHVRARKTLFGTVRDPLSWYVSWYTHAFHNPAHRERLRVFGSGEEDFESVMRGALYPRLDRCPDSPGVIWEVPVAGRRVFLGRGESLYTWAFRYIYGEVPHFIRMENLAESLGKFLHLRIDTKTYPPRNTRSERSTDVKVEYSDELRDLVRERDGGVARLLGYLD
jgi:hypothetical protein